MNTPEHRALLQSEDIRRWRTQLGIAGAEAIEDGEALTPEEQEAFTHEYAVAMASMQQIAAPSMGAIQQFAASAGKAVKIVGNAVRALETLPPPPYPGLDAALATVTARIERIQQTAAYNARMAARVQQPRHTRPRRR